MATTTSNSLIPTSTFASAPSTSTNDTDDGGESIFSSAGSPPLIVAFLAIGLFVVAMIGIFGWRRVTQSHRLDQQPVVPNRRRMSITLGKRPVLWDVWADPKVSETSLVEATRWENITPMTAILTFLIPPVPIDPPPIIGSVDPAHTPLQMLRYLASAVKRFYLADPPPPPPPLAGASDDKAVDLPASPPPDEMEWGDVSSLQVSVIIAMPTQACGSVTSGKDLDPERSALGELGEFCIGTMEVPWSEAG